MEYILITGIRNNMKNTLMRLKDKMFLGKRLAIETVKDEQKQMSYLVRSIFVISLKKKDETAIPTAFP